MRDASIAFANTVARSHRIAVRCDVLLNREVIVEGITVVGGEVSYDRTASRLASLSIRIADPTRLPVAPDDVLTPYGYELQVWRGVELVDGSELVPLGTFPIQRSNVEGVSLMTSIAAEDRSRLVSDARFEDTYQVAAGTNFATAIQALVEAGVSGLEYLFPEVEDTTPLLTFDAESDRWEVAQAMARSIGYELVFNGLGQLVMRPEPTFDSEPVAVIAEGVNLVDVTLSLDRATAYNKVIAVGRNASTGAQYRGEVADMDPSSPTFYDGPFGKKPEFYRSEFLSSNAQATYAAAMILQSNLGVAKSVNFGAVPDPRLECGDVVQVTRVALGIDELHIIDAMSIGLSPEDGMSGETRAQQLLVES